MSTNQYTYPPAFDVARAQELGKLIDSAYVQLAAANDHTGKTAWALPDGYQCVLSPFTALEPGGGGVLEAVKDDITNPKDILGNIEQGIGLRAPAKLPFGFIVSKPAAAGGREVFVVIRGTITSQEWMDDFTADPVPFDPADVSWGKTTKGFKALHDVLIVQILAALNGMGLTAADTVYVTGHSLGAALALLVAAKLSTVLPVKPVTYTFSGPRTGDPDFAAAYAAANIPTWRIFNTEDLVPTLPLAATDLTTKASWNALAALFGKGYEHVGYPIAITFWMPDVADNHNCTNVWTALAPQAGA